MRWLNVPCRYRLQDVLRHQPREGRRRRPTQIDYRISVDPYGFGPNPGSPAYFGHRTVDSAPIGVRRDARGAAFASGSGGRRPAPRRRGCRLPPETVTEGLAVGPAGSVASKKLFWTDADTAPPPAAVIVTAETPSGARPKTWPNATLRAVPARNSAGE